jgi:glycosyltransferase involved in cell wall biosynthesis
LKEKLRILHLPTIALYQPYLLCKGLRELGHKVDYMIIDGFGNEWLTYDWDVNLELYGKPLHRRVTVLTKYFLDAVEQYDIFNYHSTPLSIPGTPIFLYKYLCMDFRLLKRLGKKLAMNFWGCDMRRREIDEKYEFSPCEKCVSRPSFLGFSCNNKLKSRYDRLTLKYADVRMASGDLCVAFKDMIWLPNAIDTGFWKPLPFEEIPPEFRLPDTNALRIYHSFGNADIRFDAKGTFFIKEAVERLRADGHNVEFIFFDRVPNRDLRFYQMQADIVVDQLMAGSYGSTAIECMSMGKPVVGYLRDDVLAIAPKGLPIVNTNPNTIYERLKVLVDDASKREDLGRKSREFAVRVHDYKKVAKKLEGIYYSLYN